MRYTMLATTCAMCGRPFTCNFAKVPSVRVDGTARAVCKQCVEQCVEDTNHERLKRGLKPFTIPHNAYEPCSEEELP